MKDFLTFKTFPDKEVALDFAEVLKQQDIVFFIEEDMLVFDPSYSYNPLNKDYVVKVRSRDFTRATEAYENFFATLTDQVDHNYYLFSFTDEELKEIITKPDEWGSFDYQLAQKLLKDKGITYSEEEKQTFKAHRNKELARPEQETLSNIALYYFLSFIIFPVGMIIGWVWAYSKKTLPNGQRVFAYDKSVQKHGKRILRLTTFLAIFFVYWKIIGPYTYRH